MSSEGKKNRVLSISVIEFHMSTTIVFNHVEKQVVSMGEKDCGIVFCEIKKDNKPGRNETQRLSGESSTTDLL